MAQAVSHQSTGNVQLVHSKSVTVLMSDKQVPRRRSAISARLPFNDLHISRVNVAVLVRVVLPILLYTAHAHAHDHIGSWGMQIDLATVNYNGMSCSRGMVYRNQRQLAISWSASKDCKAVIFAVCSIKELAICRGS